MLAVVGTLAGLVLLVLGADRVVRDGTSLAGRYGVSPMVVGLTVVSIGTSLPELAIGLSAARQGDAALAVGNIVGTNLVNILLVLGLAAALSPLAFQARVLRFDLPAMVGASALLVLLARDGELTIGDGAWLLAYAAVYFVLVARAARAETRAPAAADVPQAVASKTSVPRTTAPTSPTRDRWAPLTLLLATAVLVIGAELLVDGATALARDLGASDALIGLTVVAIGTSAPELVTTVVSTFRGDRDLALGNILGSSVLNIALILGLTVVVSPDATAIPEEILLGDLTLMAATTLLCVPIFLSGRRMGRAEGILCVALYAGYLTWLLTTRV